MTLAHELFVAKRFDHIEGRFKCTVAASDVRLRALLDTFTPCDGRSILDVGCGKGRFAAHLEAVGARVVGLDLSPAMLARAPIAAKVIGSASRLPFRNASFDGVALVEVLEHVAPTMVPRVLAEARRVLQPGGRVVIVDKNRNALDARRPWLPAVCVKRLDERRGRWMYHSNEPVREHWFAPRALHRQLAHHFEQVRYHYLLRPEEAPLSVFRRLPPTRLLVAWTGTAPEGRHA